MKIGLIDIDSHNFPNLALMKLSAYHKAQGDTVDWWDGFTHYDIVYKAKVFDDTYSYDDNTVIKADQVVCGGTGYDLKNQLTPEVEHQYPDYSLYPDFDEAYGFLTRGCPRACAFCIVAEKEGRHSYQVDDLPAFWRGQKTIKLLDPNLLACPEHEKLIEQLAASSAWVDYTQGLDARLLTRDNIALLQRVKTNMVHFAWDSEKDTDAVLRGLKLYKQITKVDRRKAGVYVLTNFDTAHEFDLYRVETLRELGYDPYIMIYNKPSAPEITRHLQRYANNRMIWATTPTFAQFDPKKG